MRRTLFLALCSLLLTGCGTPLVYVVEERTLFPPAPKFPKDGEEYVDATPAQLAPRRERQVVPLRVRPVCSQAFYYERGPLGRSSAYSSECHYYLAP